MGGDAKANGEGIAWWLVAGGGALALAVVAIVACLIAPSPGALRRGAIPVASATWLRPVEDGVPANGPWRGDAGVLADLPRDGLPTQVRLRLADAPGGDGDVTLFLPAAAGAPDVFVNGANLPASAALGAPYPAAPRMRPMALTIPHSWFRPGANHVDAIFAPAGPVLMMPPLLLDAGGHAAPRALAWVAPLRQIATASTLLAAVLALGAVAFANSRGWFLGLAAAAAAAGCRLLANAADLTPWLAAHRVGFDHALLASTLASLVCAVLNRPRASPPQRWVALAIGAASALTIATMLIAVRDVFEPYSGLWLARLEAFHGCGLVALSLALASASAWVFGRGATRFAVARLNLARTVRLQKIEIEQTRGELERQQRRGAILEERQRLARDVHDGVGGALASLLARIRMRRIDIDQIESELVGGLADLRLIVDSMDAAGENVGAALAVFRARIAPQVEQAGMRLHWQQAETLGSGGEDPQWILHLYRLMQEAVNNALRHSGGGELRIVVDALGAGRLRVDIVDDGAGLPQQVAAIGNGMSNMAWRARRLGAQLRIEPASAAGGTRVRVEVALPNAGAAQSS